MAKQLNVNLAFTADTGKAKAQLQDLQNQLNKVINLPTSGLDNKLTKEISEAGYAAAELKVHLENAVNVKTGSLDFSKFNQSLKKSGVTLSEYANKIKDIGPEGQKAFVMLAQSIASAEVPIKRSNALLSELWVTMKNTIRWQLTSSMLHGFMGAIQSAVGYAGDLNESLNNIRIVTGNSVDEMAMFAKEANKAAKALSTTTTEYTDAALIYYQQGLNDQQVKDRTDITIKMANVSRQSAEVVSDQMTAVWNNFYDGSQSLEHYADAMTKLGADTASSSDEIAQGLEKFAAIGDTIGLSFDNAAAALATVTATTRQSADVVGTAFKTIFARIQGLSLGETLDDGTNLNKYSEALSKVGISIFEQNGELKNMDNILSEMGAKWETLNKSQQVALAQTVAGTRQYNQLVALLDNFDFYEQNLSSAQNADGTLQAQADIYAESWEAASNRVDASLESIYNKLLNDEFFIDVLNSIADIIEGVDNLIDRFGGLRGTLTLVGALLTKVFSNQIADTIQNIGYNTKNLFDEGAAVRQERANELKKALEELDNDTDATAYTETSKKVLQAQLDSQQYLIDNAKTLSETEKQTLQILLDQQKVRGDIAIKAAEQKDKAKEKLSDASAIVIGYHGLGGNETQDIIKRAKSLGRRNAVQEFKDSPESFQALRKQLHDQADAFADTQSASAEAKKALRGYIDAAIDYGATVQDVSTKTYEATQNIQSKNAAETNNSNTVQENTNKQQENVQATDVAGDKKQEAAHQIDQHSQALDKNSQSAKDNSDKMKLSAEGFVQGAQSVMQIASAIQIFSSSMDTLSDPNTEPWDQFLSAITGLGMGIPMLYGGLKSLSGMVVTAGGKTLGAVAGAKGLGAAFAGIAGGTSTALGGILALLPHIAIAAAAIGGLIFVIKACSDAYNADAIAAERAAKTANKLADDYANLTNRVNEFNNAIANYGEGKNALETLDKNTKEYSDTLEDTNKKARELIETYKLFDKFDYEHGIITIDPDEIERLKKEQELRQRQMEAQVAASKIDLNQANLDDEATQLGRSIKYTIEASVQGRGASDVTLSANKEQIYALSKAIADIREEAGGVSVDAQTLREEIQNSADNYGLSNTILTNLNDFINDDTLNSLYNFCDSVNEAAKANAYYAQQILGISAENVYGESFRDIAKDDENLYNSLNAAATTLLKNSNANIDEFITAKNIEASNKVGDKVSTQDDADNTERNIKQYLSELLSGSEGFTTSEEWLKNNYSKIFQGVKDSAYVSNMSTQDMLKAYYTAQGYTVTSLKNGTGTNDLSLTDSEGHISNISVDNDIAQKLWAEQITSYAIQHMADTMASNAVSAKSLMNIFSSIVDSGSQYGTDWSQSFIDGIANNNTFDFSSLYAELSPSEHEDILKKSGEELAQVFGLTEEDLKQLGFNSFTVFDEAFTAGMSGWTEEIYKNAADVRGETSAKTNDLDLEEFKIYRDLLLQQNQAYKDNAEGLNLVAVANKRLERGVKTVSSDWNDWNKILSQTNPAAEDVSAVLKDLNPALQDMLNISEEEFSLLPPDFAKKHWDLITDVANGVEGAIDKLRNKAGEEILITVDGVVDPNGNINQGILDIHNAIASFDGSQFEVGISIDKEKEQAFYDSCQTMINAAGMTAEQAQAYFASMGYNVEFNDNPQKVQEQVTEYKYTYDYDEDGNPTYRHVEPVIKTVETEIDAPTIETITPSGSYGGGVGVSTKAPKSSTISENGGGGGAKKAPKKSDIVDRYKETNDALDDVTDALEDANKQTDRLYGQSRINKIKEANKAIEQEVALLERKKDEAEAYLKIDRQLAQAKAQELGFTLQFDGSGLIQNYTAVLSALYEKIAANPANEDLQEKINDLKDLISQYDETREMIEDIDNQIDDKWNEWQDNNYEQLHYALEIEIELNDMELEKLDYYLNKIADDFYSMAEAAQYMVNQNPIWSDSLSQYEKFYNELNDAYSKKEISQEAYVEGLKESYSAILDNLSSLNDLDKKMMHYYGDTLDAASEELSYYTDQLSNLTSVLDHYRNIVALVHGEYDFNRVETILKGQAATIKNELDVATANYKMLKTEKAAIEASYAATADSAQKELLEEELKNITTALSEAQEEMLSMTEAWGEAMQAIMQNTMDAAAHDLEAAFTGGMGFDSLSNSLDRLVTFQDEYLTKTNQLYETQKIMRTAQQASDKTDNEAAKLKFKNYISEIQQLQEKDQLSQLDLEIAQARYDLLLAEIALTEAQNAKSTVRLQRDSEGNFGYVYTADQEVVSAAEQELADAENALYNIGLQATNDYGQKRIELQQQLADELIALNERRAAGEFETDELFYAERDRIISEYNNLFIAYSNQYTTALGVDVNIQKDAWVLAYQEMIDKTANWKDATDLYLTKTEEAYTNYRQIIESESEIVSSVLDDVEGNVKDVTNESDKLTKEVVEDVVPALKDELVAVRNVTSAYAAQRSEIQSLISYYERLAGSIRGAIAEQARLDGGGSSSDFGDGGSKDNGESSKNSEASSLATEAQELVRRVHYGYIGGGGAWKAAAKQAGYSDEAISIALKAFNNSKEGAGYDYYYDQALKLAGSYDTGGYTGAWGPEGRLAMLHEKELILNKVDTENFLTATEILRSISNMIDLQALHNYLSLSSNSFGIPLGGTQQLEQSVMIEANFPNVQDRNEIQEAFNNLINTASQYANRKN